MSRQKFCVVCMKWGTMYGNEYVNMLHRAVSDHLQVDHDFICITDNFEGLDSGIKCRPLDFPQMAQSNWEYGKFPKVLMFDRRIVEGYDAALFLDLDIMVTGDLTPLLKIVRDKGGLYLMPKFRGLLWRMIPAAFWDLVPGFMNQVTRGNSSVVGFVPAEQFHLYDNFDAAKHHDEYGNDQNYVSKLAYKRKCYPKNWCIGLVHLVPYWPFGLIFKTYRKLPDRPKIVIFHGRPNPDELVNDDIGYWSIGRRHAYGGIGWVADYLQKYGS
ncbi:hypothetical protein [Roseibium sp. RKSG952]|uniref:hypothetical protein n=1 Tax=Roseibium sp. RKSG952 TaxID=2529384 RepID=UPI0012BD5C55|nr:hypothetical protein [Roseibium sp. RKSG952]MTH98519.1 hypothetical protein [Roseibium sp. RKSG952]